MALNEIRGNSYGLPGLPCRFVRRNSEEIFEAMDRECQADNERLRAELPKFIAAEHSTGANIHDDNLSLMVAYQQELSRNSP